MSNCICNPTVGDGPSFPCDCNSPVLLGPPVSRNCSQRQAPHGYRYRLINGDCVMVSASSGMPIIEYTPVVAVASSPVETIKSWIAQNKGLSLAIAAGAFYFFTKDK